MEEIVESQHEELHCARAEVQQRYQQLLQGQLLQQNLELREAQQRSLTEMEELRKFQSSTFDTNARAAKHLGHMAHRETFLQSRCVIISTFSSRIEPIEFIDRGAASFIHSGTE